MVRRRAARQSIPEQVRFDYTNLMAEAVGKDDGLALDELRNFAPRARGAVEWLRRLRAHGRAEWMDLPYQRDLADRVVAAGDAIAARCDAFVVLGIGGSALGAIALHTALRHLHYNQLPPARRAGRPRFYVLDNVDPDFVESTLDLLDLKRAVFNVVTKSGSTAETMAQLAIVRERLARELGPDVASHIVATTDPEAGDLLKLAEREGYETFGIAPTVGGRFSALSPVGLLPAAVSGIDVRELLAGAVRADADCRDDDLWANPALLSAAAHFLLYERGKHVTVMMPYSQHLVGLADWFRQLWAESLGKTRRADRTATHVGLTPVAALGTTDQHSQLQLYADGPADKVITFVGVDRFARTATIPRTELGLSSLDYLGGHTLNELINAERIATALSLTAKRRPNCTFLLPEVRPFTVGYLMYLLEVETALLGNLLEIDPFDQPGVEAGKIATYALLGRPGYQERAKDLIAGARMPRSII